MNRPAGPTACFSAACSTFSAKTRSLETVTTETTELCQESRCPISATATLKCSRSRSFRLLTTCRLSFREWECSTIFQGSTLRSPGQTFQVHQRLPADVRSNKPVALLLRRRQHGGDSLRRECLEHVAHIDVVVIHERNTAFEPVLDLARIVLEAFERIDFAGVDDLAAIADPRIWPSRRIAPSVTKHPATTPTLLIRKVSRTSAWPRWFPCKPVQAVPVMANWISSISS